jgi:hypothetical protein
VRSRCWRTARSLSALWVYRRWPASDGAGSWPARMDERTEDGRPDRQEAVGRMDLRAAARTRGRIAPHPLPPPAAGDSSSSPAAAAAAASSSSAYCFSISVNRSRAYIRPPGITHGNRSATHRPQAPNTYSISAGWHASLAALFARPTSRRRTITDQPPRSRHPPPLRTPAAIPPQHSRPMRHRLRLVTSFRAHTKPL